MKKIYLSVSFIVLVIATNAQTLNLQWAKSMGGTSTDVGYSTAVDAAGNVYTVGGFQGTADFDPGPGTFNLTSAGSVDVFVSKLDAAGNFVWVKQLGGTSGELAHSVSVDANGNVYTTGTFGVTADFDPGPGTFNLTTAGIGDVFVSKLDAAGNFVWAKRLGGTTNDNCFSSTVDGNGNVYTTGYFDGTSDFDPGPGTFNLVSAGGFEIYISKLDAAGNFVWAKQMGGTSDDDAFSITVDGSANVYTTGRFKGTADFDPGAGIFNLTAAGDNDIFVSKLDAAGNFVWAKQMGGTAFDGGSGIAVDGSGNVYTTGSFYQTADFDPSAGTFNLTSAGQNDIFISKLDAAGNFVWAKQMGGTFIDGGASIAVDGALNVYTVGTFYETGDFDPGTCTFNLTSPQFNSLFTADVFVSKLDASGNFIFAKQMGSPTTTDEGLELKIDGSGTIYISGDYGGVADFDPEPGVFNLTGLGNGDIFVAKYTQTTIPPTVTINQAAAQPDPATVSPVNFTVVFSDPVTGFITGDVVISGTAGATTATVTGCGTTYNVAVSGMTTSGTVIVTIPASVAVNISGTANLASTSTDNTVTFTIANPPPTVTINQAAAQPDPTTSSPINFTVVFNEAVTGFATGDVTLSGAAGATTATVTGSGTTYNIAVSGMTASGTVVATIAAGVATDAGGAGNLASTSTDNSVTFTIAVPPPTVTINQAAAQPDPTTTSPINFTVIFNEAVTGFATGDVTLSGTAGATTATVTGSGTTYNVAVSGMSTSGTVIATIPAGVAINAGGTGNLASTSTDNTVTFTIVVPPPTVTINQAAAQPDPATTSPINFTVVFNEAVTGFATGDIILSGTAGATTATVTGSGTTYNVAVSGMTANGTVVATIPAGVAMNEGGTGNLASTSTDNTVTFTIAAPPPTVTINQAAAQPDPTTSSPINFTVVFNETVTGFATGDVVLSGTAGATTTTVTGSGTNYNVAVSGMTANGTVVATIPAGVAINTGGTGNLASTSTDNTVTFTTQTCTITCPSNITVNNTAAQCGAIVNFPAPTLTGSCGTVTTSPASGSFFPVGTTIVTSTSTTGSTCSFTITVINTQLAAVTTQPVSKPVCVNSNTAFSVAATNATSYQWQVNSGNGFNNINGATGSILTLNNVTTAMTGNQYRVIIAGACTNVISTNAILTVNPLPIVTLNLTVDSLYKNSPVLTLSGSLPVGGLYSGTGVNNGIFNPATIQQGNYIITYTFTDAIGCSNSAADQITILPKADRVNIYPNPSPDGNMNILVFPDMDGADVRVYDAEGRKVKQWIIKGKLNTYHLKFAAGTYIFEFTKGALKEVKKVIIIR